MSNSAPEGFEPHFKKSPVTDPWEPLYSRNHLGTIQIGVWVREAHCNSRGMAHGGLIATLADNAMGLSYGAMAKAAGLDLRSAVTVSLTIDYTASAKLGQWLLIEPRVIKAGKTMGFVDALITADGTPIGRASATFHAV